MLLGLVLVIAVGFFAFSLTSYLNRAEVAGTLPQIGETSAPPTGVPEPDLNPSKWPIPTDGTQAEQWLVDNPLYQQSVQVPVNCTVGRFNPKTISPEQLQQELTVLSGCLMMVWTEPMERAGFELPRPPVTTYSQPITTACGDSETHNAFYCTLDQRIYYATDFYEVFYLSDPSAVDNEFQVANIMGHEFGHALQARAGIWAAYAGFKAGASKEGALELGRRSETQADCFSGMFLNAVAQASRMTDTDRVETADVSQGIGDDELSGDPDYVSDHGTGKARRTWFETGNRNALAGSCNTWNAPSDQVR